MERTRTHNCGELRLADEGGKVVLMGWLRRVRDQGGIVFIDLRDRYGLTQVVVEPGGPVSLDEARELKREYVIAVSGTVRKRPGEMANRNLPTGEVEVVAEELEVLNRCRTPPFVIEDEVDASDDTLLQYRFLDLRRPKMQQFIGLRHRASRAARNYLCDNGFLEIETPLLVRNSPEGARDFLVPSRIAKGKFYSLPQSPQIYKQILMVAGCDRYFQIARCLRDEDLRADRQVEFTQIDIELSFTTEEEVFRIMDGLMATIWKEAGGHDIPTPVEVISHREAMESYGSDKPDVRFDLKIVNLDEMAERSEFRAFRGVLDDGGTVRGFAVPGGASFSRKEIDSLEEKAKTYGAKGLAWTRVREGKLDGGVGRFFDFDDMVKSAGANDGDLVVMVAGPWKKALESLGQVRLAVAERLDIVPKDEFRFLWVNKFPLFDWDEEEGRWEPAHHMFTMPFAGDVAKLETDPGSVHAHLYDMTLNGVEIASGSIRCHDPELQRRIMAVVGIEGEEADRRFGFLLNALAFGAPPHGGIAYGWDRMMAVLGGAESIRDVIAFPKTMRGLSLMDGCPSAVDEELLTDLGIALVPEEGETEG